MSKIKKGDGLLVLIRGCVNPIYESIAAVGHEDLFCGGKDDFTWPVSEMERVSSADFWSGPYRFCGDHFGDKWRERINKCGYVWVISTKQIQFRAAVL